MQAKIVTEKVVVRGEKMRKIIRFEGILAEKELPVEYVKTLGPKFALTREERVDIFIPTLVESPQMTTTPNGTTLVCWKGSDNHTDIFLLPGYVIPELLYQEALVWMRRSGARLAKINRRLAAENADWHGEEVIEI